jgi:hypothetical protein
MKSHYMSKYIRRFCFWAGMLQILFEGNISYFTYLFFNQSKMLFFFTYRDKFIIGTSIVFFGFVIITTAWFFYLVNYLYEDNAKYFIYYFYRIKSTLVCLSFNIVFRSFIQAVIHSLLHNNYVAMISVLSILELISVVSAILI